MVITLWLSAVLNFHCDWPGKLLHCLAMKPKDGTDQMGVFRELILASYGSLDVDSALLHVCWQAAVLKEKPQTKAWPCDLLTVGSIDHHCHFSTHFYTT